MLAKAPKRTVVALRPRPITNFSEYLDQLFENFRQDMLTGFVPGPPIWEKEPFERFLPALADLEDKGKMYELRANLPGLRKENIDVRLMGHTLQIDAKDASEKEEKGKHYLYHERAYQGFTRTIDLPEDVLSEKIAAKYLDGVLSVEIPKAHPEPEKHIVVG